MRMYQHLITRTVCTLAVVSCARSDTAKDPDLELGEFEESTTTNPPGGEDHETGEESLLPDSWTGPAIEPTEDGPWGGFSYHSGALDCYTWYQLAGVQEPCDDCTLHFELVATHMDNECGLTPFNTDMTILVIDGRIFANSFAMGTPTYGDGLLTWDWLTDDVSYKDHYSGFLRY